MLEAVLDTNFLMLANQFRVDIFGELDELLGKNRKVTCSGAVEELERLGLGGGRDSVAARYALKLLKLGGVEVKSSEGKVDDWIVGYCVRNGAVACTVDRKLIERLKKEGVKVVILRGKSRLQFV
jgi:rRNA-processing protein FCF1